MSDTVQGDPASLSQAGGSLRRTASGLRGDRARSAAVFGELERHWSGRASVAARRRAESLLATTGSVAAALDSCGAAIQELATDLAESLHTARSVTARAGAVGLQVVDGEVSAAWGVLGEVSGADVAQREQARMDLQRELDVVMVQLGRRRARLVSTLDTSRGALAAEAERLRTEGRKR